MTASNYSLFSLNNCSYPHRQFLHIPECCKRRENLLSRIEKLVLYRSYETEVAKSPAISPFFELLGLRDYANPH
jgi:hypothetical protein